MSQGVFPDCGCYYTTDDDGIHFCPMHEAAPDMLEVLKMVEKVMNWGIAPDAGDRRMVADAIAKAEGRQ